jgi:hypothetical protein
MSLCLQICRDVWGTWCVHGLSPLPVAHLPSLSASLDYARRECRAAPATIELQIDGFYAVVYQEEGWPRRVLAHEAEPPRPTAQENGIKGRAIAASYSVATSVARSRSSWFIEWRAAATRLIASLASGLAAMKRSKSACPSTSSRQ